MWPVQTEMCGKYKTHSELQRLGTINDNIKYVSNNFNVHDNILDMLGSLKCLIEVNFTCFLLLFKNTRLLDFKITDVASALFIFWTVLVWILFSEDFQVPPG